MFKLSDDIPEDRMAAAQERLRQDINRTRIEEGKKHPPYKEPKTIEEWWAVVDEWWVELLSLVERYVKLDQPVEENGKLLGVTGHIHIAQLKQDRDPKLAGYFDAAWTNAPDMGYIHAIPGWGILCDLCSEQWVFDQEGEVNVLTELQYAETGKGPWRLYLFGEDGLHGGVQWFCNGEPKYPNEQISSREAMIRALDNIARGLEVRITDSGDMLVFHSQNGKVLYPESGHDFWKEVGGK